MNDAVIAASGIAKVYAEGDLRVEVLSDANLSVARGESVAIIGTSGDLDPYQLPDSKGFTALSQHLAGVTTATRQRIRDEVLATDEGHFRKFGTLLREAASSGLVCVLGGEDSLAKAGAQGLDLERTIRLL